MTWTAERVFEELRAKCVGCMSMMETSIAAFGEEAGELAFMAWERTERPSPGPQTRMGARDVGRAELEAMAAALNRLESERGALTAEQRERMAQAADVVAALPGLRLITQGVGTLPDEPDYVRLRLSSGDGYSDETFRFYDLNSLRRRVLAFARRLLLESKESAKHVRERLGEKEAEVRACEAKVAELDRLVKR